MILYVLGTRPEAIKLAPLIEKTDDAEVIFVQQHNHAVKDVLNLYGIKYTTIPVNETKRFPAGIMSRIMTLDSHIVSLDPDMIVVQGDTSTAFMGALAGYYAGIPVAHVEAGLRTYSRDPYPEETHRICIDRMSKLHFCPTYREMVALAADKNMISDCLESVGNTGIDALYRWAGNVEKERSILVTCHRRENYRHLKDIACRINDLSEHVHIRYMLHQNPNADMTPYLSKSIEVLEPMRYDKFVLELAKSFAVLTDSGGLSEECPALGIPVGILRNETERTDVINEGAGILLGSSYRIITWVVALLNGPELYAKYAQKRTIYGDGFASERILHHIHRFLGEPQKFKKRFWSR